MTKATLIGLILLASCLSVSAQTIDYETSPPLQIETQILSPDGTVQASLYRTTGETEPNRFKQGETFLEIRNDEGSWWVNTPEGYDELKVLDFIDNRRLLLALRIPASDTTAILNIENRALNLLGQGSGQYLNDGPNRGLILMGKKGYSEGAYWYTALVDPAGNTIEVISNGGANCIPLREILNTQTPPATLRQSLDECIGVER